MLRICTLVLALSLAARAEGPDDSDFGGPMLRFYGFADFSYDRYLYGSGSGWDQYAVFPDSGAFSVGKLNLFIDGQLSPRARSLIEVRFTYLGNSPLVGDYSESRTAVPAAGIVLERAWVEYQLSEMLTVRAGQFLTPYGVWNVDHGSPALIDVFPPYVITQQIMPRSQIGVEAYGNKFLGKLRLGWNLTVSNGRTQSVTDDWTGAVPAYESFNHRFGFGGRGWLEGRWLGTLRMGASFFTGRYTERNAARDLVQQYDEVSFAADLKWELKRFLVVGEALQQRVSFTDEGRAAFSQVLGVDNYADYTASGWYLLAGYRLPIFEVMPFVMAQRHAPNDTKPHQSMYAITGGVNVRVLPNLVVKASLTRPFWPDAKPENKPYSDTLTIAAAQVAWAF